MVRGRFEQEAQNLIRGVIRAWSASDPKVIRYVLTRSGQVQCTKTHGKMRDPHWGTCTLYYIWTLACICLKFHCQMLCRVENSIAWHDMAWDAMHNMTWHGQAHGHDMTWTWYAMTWHAWHDMTSRVITWLGHGHVHVMSCHVMACDVMPCHVMHVIPCHVHVRVMSMPMSCLVEHLMSCHVVPCTSGQTVLTLANWL